MDMFKYERSADLSLEAQTIQKEAYAQMLKVAENKVFLIEDMLQISEQYLERDGLVTDFDDAAESMARGEHHVGAHARVCVPHAPVVVAVTRPGVIPDKLMRVRRGIPREHAIFPREELVVAFKVEVETRAERVDGELEGSRMTCVVAGSHVRGPCDLVARFNAGMIGRTGRGIDEDRGEHGRHEDEHACRCRSPGAYAPHGPSKWTHAGGRTRSMIVVLFDTMRVR